MEIQEFSFFFNVYLRRRIFFFNFGFNVKNDMVKKRPRKVPDEKNPNIYDTTCALPPRGLRPLVRPYKTIDPNITNASSLGSLSNPTPQKNPNKVPLLSVHIRYLIPLN